MTFKLTYYVIQTILLGQSHLRQTHLRQTRRVCLRWGWELPETPESKE